jgi:C4-dicarboxylate-specific signal transduction histidine kinase
VGGRPVEWFGTDTDVEDLRQAEEALQRSRAEMAHVARVTTLGQLAASIAHEINQPLAAVVTNGLAGLRWLDARPANLDEARDAFARVVRDGNRAAEVIVRIRQFLRRGHWEPVAVDIGRLIADVLTIVQGELRARGVVQRFAPVDGGLPAVSADPVQMRQVVLNLILNAIDAMRPVPEPRRTLDIAVAREGADALRICVRDSGVGLAPDDRERAFEAFHTTKPDGMGMGLAIACSIVEAHGGRLWATANEDGPGETFQFTLPLAPG